MKAFSALLLLIVAAIVGFGLYKTLSSPGDLYSHTGRFAGCPSRPSCVSSQSLDDVHRVPALGYTGDPYMAMVMLRELVQRMGGHIDNEQPGYLHVVFFSKRLRFRDDLELLVLPEGGRIEVRSASRFSYSDMGTNRSRVEELRRAFEAAP